MPSSSVRLTLKVKLFLSCLVWSEALPQLTVFLISSEPGMSNDSLPLLPRCWFTLVPAHAGLSTLVAVPVTLLVLAEVSVAGRSERGVPAGM